MSVLIPHPCKAARRRGTPQSELLEINCEKSDAGREATVSAVFLSVRTSGRLEKGALGPYRTGEARLPWQHRVAERKV